MAEPLGMDGETIVRLARHRTIYDVALAFYAVLVAFVLDGPLKALANSLVASPSGQGLNDWASRLLTLILLLQAAVWLHALVVSVELSDTRSDEGLYKRSITTFWSGVVMVVILMTLGSAVERGTATFLTVSLAYVLWGLIYSLASRKMASGDAEPRKSMATFNITDTLANLLILVGLVIWAQLGPSQGVQPFLQALVWLLIVIVSVCRNYWKVKSYYIV